MSDATAGASSVAAPPDRVLVVRVHTDHPSVASDQVRDAVALELGVIAVEPEDERSRTAGRQLAVTYRASTGELAVTYSEGDSTITRVISSPDAGMAVRAAALLAGNLARHQAETWLEPRAPAAEPAPSPSPSRSLDPSLSYAPEERTPPPRSKPPRGGARTVFVALWTSTTTYVNAGLKLAGDRVHAVFSVGAHEGDEGVVAGPGAALGATFPVGATDFVDADVAVSYLLGDPERANLGFFTAERRWEDVVLLKAHPTVRHGFESWSVFGGLGASLRFRPARNASARFAVDVLLGVEL